MARGLVRSAWSTARAYFPLSIIFEWFDVYSKEHPGIHFNYQSIGSGGGIRMIPKRLWTSEPATLR